MKGDTNEQALLKGLAHNDSKAVEIIYKHAQSLDQAAMDDQRRRGSEFGAPFA